MERSDAFIDFINQTRAEGRQRMVGYNPMLLELIYESERDEVEDIIVDTFVNRPDTDLAIFLPKLKNYDGIDILKENLDRFTIPSEANADIAFVLWEETKQEIYLEKIVENLEKSINVNKLMIIASLSYCTPNNQVYEVLKSVYLNDNDDTNRSAALTGILYNKGLIINRYDIQEKNRKVELRRKFYCDDKVDREKMIQKLENGEIEFS